MTKIPKFPKRTSLYSSPPPPSRGGLGGGDVALFVTVVLVIYWNLFGIWNLGIGISLYD
jgi:hypothetical protein